MIFQKVFLCTPAILKIVRFALKACLLSRLLQTGEVQTKASTIERKEIWQGSSSKRLFIELPSCTVYLKEG